MYRELRRKLIALRDADQPLTAWILQLKKAAKTSPQAAMLLRDLWAVLCHTESEVEATPGKILEGMHKVIQTLERLPFSGEEVMF